MEEITFIIFSLLPLLLWAEPRVSVLPKAIECFTVNEKGQVLIGDAWGSKWTHPHLLTHEQSGEFEDCERKGKNKHVDGEGNLLGGNDQCFTVKKEGKFIAVKIGDMWLTPEQLPDEVRKKFEDCERKGKNKVVGEEDQCFTVEIEGNAIYILIEDMWLTPEQLTAYDSELRKKFDDCERKGKNKVVGGEDQCFTVIKEGNVIYIIIDDMWLTPEQLPVYQRKKFEDCIVLDWSPDYVWRRRSRKRGDQCFTVKKEGNTIFIKIGDMWLTLEQLPIEQRKKFEDCERRGKNKVDEPVEPHEGEKRNNIWPDYVWKKGSREQEGKRKNFGADYVWRKGSSEGGRVVTREVGRNQQVKK